MYSLNQTDHKTDKIKFLRNSVTICIKEKLIKIKKKNLEWFRLQKILYYNMEMTKIKLLEPFII